MLNNAEVLKQELLKLVLNGSKIEAIKRYREVYKTGLKEAKDAVEELIINNCKPSIEPDYLTANGANYERTIKPFDLAHLVADRACVPGLIDLLKYASTQISVYTPWSFFDFKIWWNTEGRRHVEWLEDHDYLTRAPDTRFYVGDKFTIHNREYILAHFQVIEGNQVIECNQVIEWNQEKWYATLIKVETGCPWSESVRLSDENIWSIDKESLRTIIGNEGINGQDIINTRVPGPNDGRR